MLEEGGELLREMDQRRQNLERAAAENQRLQKAAETKLHQAQANLEAREVKLQAHSANIQAQAVELEEQRKRQMTALRNAEAMFRTPSEAAGARAIGQYLRKQHLQGAALGDLLTATFIADRSGFIRLAWAVQIDRARIPMVSIERDGDVIRTDHALAGEHGDHIVPGRRYFYTFRLKDDRGNVIGQGVEFEVKIPTPKVWDDLRAGNDDELQRRIREQFMSRYNGMRVTEELKAECYADVKAKHYPEDMEEWLLSRIDALATELSGEGGN